MTEELIAEARDMALYARAHKHGAVSHADMIDSLADALEAATAETKWEYRAKVEWIDPYDPRRHPNYYLSQRKPFTDAEVPAPGLVDYMTGKNAFEGCYLEAQERRRAAGPWEPVEGM